MTTLVVRFSDRVSEMETTHQRLKDIAEHLGVSQNKAIQRAINHLYEQHAVEMEFKRHGVQVGGVTYLNTPKEQIERIAARIKAGIPLPHVDDGTLENHIMFALLLEEEQAKVKAEPDMLEKRKMIEGFLADA